MNTGTILKVSFFAGFIITIIWAYLKITHAAAEGTWLFIGLALSVIFIILAMYEVITSRKINALEKVMWTLGLLFFNTITGLIYILVGRKRIVDNS